MYRQPDAQELLAAVAAFLKETCAAKLEGRDAFLARVASTALGIVAREVALSASAEASERAFLDRFAPGAADIESARAQVCALLRSGAISVEDEAFLGGLTAIVVDRVRIEQPSYASLALVKDTPGA